MALIRHRHHRPLADTIETNPDLAALRRIPDGVVDEIDENLQHPPEFGYRELAFAVRWRAQLDPLFPRTHAQNAAGLPRHIAEIDPVGRRDEIVGFHDF